jgi:hypothetical protein
VGELGDWLREVVAGTVAPIRSWQDEDDLMAFTEPNLAFSLADRDATSVRVRVHCSAEASPPWLAGTGRPPLYDWFVLLDVTIQDLLAAGAAWAEEIRVFPVR